MAREDPAKSSFRDGKAGGKSMPRDDEEGNKTIIRVLNVFIFLRSRLSFLTKIAQKNT